VAPLLASAGAAAGPKRKGLAAAVGAVSGASCGFVWPPADEDAQLKGRGLVMNG